MKRSIGHIEKLGEGKFLLRFSAKFDDFGRRLQPSKTVTCKTDKEAEIELMKFYGELDSYINDKLSNVPETLNEIYDEWLKNHVDKNLAPKTKAFYEGLWKYIEDKGKTKIKTLKPKTIYKMLDEIEVGERTVNAVFKMLKAILSKAVKWGYIEANPCDRVDTPKYRAKEQKTLAGADLYSIVDIVSNEETKYQASFYFAAVCGLRCEEIVGLKWDDIDFEKRIFRVMRGATYLVGKGTTPKETKTHKTRKIYIPDILYSVLKRHEKEQKEHRLKIGDKWIDEKWVMTKFNGSMMHVSTPSSWWSKLRKCNKEIIPEVTFHGLRHTAATLMLQNGVPISDVSSALGHALKSTTLNIYAHVIEDTKKDAVNTSANAFTRPKKDEDKKSM